MNFNQLTAAAAAAAAGGNPNSNLSMSSFANAVTNILANSNIDLSSLSNMSPHIPAFNAVMEMRRNRDQQQQPSLRQNLHQAHRSSGGSNSLNSSTLDLPSSISNLQTSDAAAAAAAAAAAVSVAGLPTSIGNLSSSALADLAANAAAVAVHQQQQQQQPQAHSARSSNSIQSAHHRSSNHHNHHSTNQLTAAHQSTSSANKASSLVAHQHHHQSQQHQQHNQNTIHHRHSSSTHHNSLSNHHNHSYNNINNHSNNLSNSNSMLLNHSSSNILNSSLSSSKTTIIATNNTNSITPPKASTCYRIGDCVYFDITSCSPSPPTLPSQQKEQPKEQQYQIGRIDEICKLANASINGDNIEVKVVVFFRRRDISSSLMTLADKYQYDESQEEEIKLMSEEDKNLLKQRELFYSRQIETIPAASIRGKCTVQLLNESESLSSYMNKDDHYFYTLVYDPQQKTITADRGEIRVGQRYQAEVQPNPIYTPQAGGDPADPRDLNELETMVYNPDHNLTDDDINKFLTIAKSVGTFARALDCSSSIKQPSLHLTAASASRDVTLLYAMQLLHQNDYDLGKAVCALVPSTGPVLCRDEIEEWTAGEATLFEEAIEKYGREFGDIRQDFLPWKSVKNIVEYYYMWKTTDRSINQRRAKALEAENKVTFLYIADPENEIKMKKSPSNLASAPSIKDVQNNDVTNNNNSTTTESGKTTATTTTTSSSSTASLVAPTTQARAGSAMKRAHESEESSINNSLENTNATLKRRQVTEPKLSTHVACHTTPGENLRFISTKRHKILRRGMINRRQLRHLSRRPWERRAKSRA